MKLWADQASTLIRADVSWESLTTEYVDKTLSENRLDDNGNERISRTGKPKKRSTTDPDATLTTSSHNSRMEPSSFKQHTVVDDKFGVVLDVEVTTGEASEGGDSPTGRITTSIFHTPGMELLLLIVELSKMDGRGLIVATIT